MSACHPLLRTRSAGILLHVTSLPGPHGIGDLGRPATSFLDWLSKTGCRIWQVLPIGPVGKGDSPYSSGSSFAIEPLLVSLEALVEDGLLPRSALRRHPHLTGPKVDYRAARKFKEPLFHLAFEIFRKEDRNRRAGYLKFFERTRHWLEPWCVWSTQNNGGSHEEHAFRQFILDRQWRSLRQEAKRRGILVFGDLPIFVPLESADVSQARELFRVRADGSPELVSGTPPDFFSSTGQLWGHPQYRWSAHKKTGFEWWVSRIKRQLELFDIIRIDHFVGLHHAWMIPAKARTARGGSWRRVPGRELLQTVKDRLGDTPLVAEDLGGITRAVETLRDDFGLPGMSLLQNAFEEDGGAGLPHNLSTNSVVYTGTHDNDTTKGWWSGLPNSTKKRVMSYAGSDGSRPHETMMRLAMTSTANTAIIPMQDLFGLGRKARMNVPGIASGNWRWRLETGMLRSHGAKYLRRMTEVTGRSSSDL